MKCLFLAKEYDLVVNDAFELFYRGVICLNNPYKYYIFVECEKGHPYPRYFTYTPKKDEVGSYHLTITLYDDEHQIVDKATTILHVSLPEEPKQRYNVLCIGDSLTFNGVWPIEGYRRFTQNDGLPVGLGYKDSLEMIGTCKKTENNMQIGYEGYGSWTWKSFCTNDLVGTASPVWIYVDHHNLDENDQHSKWCSGSLNWVLESIEEKRLKFKRGEGNYSPTPKIDMVFKHLEGGIHKDDIIVKDYKFEITNPFWDEKSKKIDFLTYTKKNNFSSIDLAYILLTWNGLYKPYNLDFSHHLDYAKILIRKIHEAYPNAHITLLGIQICSVNGGIASNYGAHGPYSDTLGTITSAFNYNKCLEALADEEEFKSYVRYVDTKAQFDSEYNMPSLEIPVNARSNIVERIGTNGVHPNMNGYLQIGDVFYRALVKDIITKNNK